MGSQSPISKLNHLVYEQHCLCCRVEFPSEINQSLADTKKTSEEETMKTCRIILIISCFKFKQKIMKSICEMMFFRCSGHWVHLCLLLAINFLQHKAVKASAISHKISLMVPCQASCSALVAVGSTAAHLKGPQEHK